MCFFAQNDTPSLPTTVCMYVIIWQIRFPDWPVNSRRKQAKARQPFIYCRWPHLRSYMYDFGWMHHARFGRRSIETLDRGRSAPTATYLAPLTLKQDLIYRATASCFIGCVSKKNLYYPTNITTAEFESRQQKHTPLFSAGLYGRCSWLRNKHRYVIFDFTFSVILLLAQNTSINNNNSFL
jgi:hypothetical protein